MSYFSEEDFRGLGTALGCGVVLAVVGLLSVIAGLVYFIYFLHTHVSINWS